MKLVKPSIDYKDSYIEALEDGFSFGWGDKLNSEVIEKAKSNFEKLLKDKFFSRKKTTRILCQDGQYYDRVPETVYWLVDDEVFIGQFNLRHHLNSFLLQKGGHVGYEIRESKRKKGYATKGLGLLLKKIPNLDLGLEKVLITANDDNIGSWKAIENNNGVLENISQEPWGEKKKFRRYWVLLAER